MADQGDEDALQAYKIITAKDNSLQDNKAADYSTYTHLGAANDATNLENMKKAVDELNKVNEYRQLEQSDNLTGSTNLNALSVTSSLMAISQYQLNYSKGVTAHSTAFNVGENVAWGYKNPFDGWYDEEKEIYKTGSEGETGHYTNIVDGESVAMGYSYAQGSQVLYNRAYGQTFASSWSSYSKNAVGVAAYQAKFNEYYNEVTQELADAKKALDDAQAAEAAKPEENKPEADKPQVTAPETSKPQVTKPTETKPETSKPTEAEPNTMNSGSQADKAPLQNESAIKNTASQTHSSSFLSLMGCAIAFAAIIGKKRNA